MERELLEKIEAIVAEHNAYLFFRLHEGGNEYKNSVFNQIKEYRINPKNNPS